MFFDGVLHPRALTGPIRTSRDWALRGNLANQAAEPILPPQRLGYRAVRDVVSPGQGG
jgi:hypothetical protein